MKDTAHPKQEIEPKSNPVQGSVGCVPLLIHSSGLGENRTLDLRHVKATS